MRVLRNEELRWIAGGYYDSFGEWHDDQDGTNDPAWFPTDASGRDIRDEPGYYPQDHPGDGIWDAAGNYVDGNGHGGDTSGVDPYIENYFDYFYGSPADSNGGSNGGNTGGSNGGTGNNHVPSSYTTADGETIVTVYGHVNAFGSGNAMLRLNYANFYADQSGNEITQASYSVPVTQTTTQNQTNLTDDQLKAQATDQAKEAAREIEADPNHTHREDAVIIYIGPDGQVHRSAMVKDVDGWDGNSGVQQLKDLAQQIGPQNIIGIVHNHDQEHYTDPYDPSLAIKNEMPSPAQVDPTTGQVVPGDWATEHGLTKAANGAHSVQMFIVGPDEQLRAYGDTETTNPTAPIGY